MLARILRKLESFLGADSIRWSNIPDGIYSFNFHRIGNWKKTRFDPCVFSCDSDKLDDLIVFFKKEFDIISIAEAVELAKKSSQKIHGKYLVITFDDGYKDNYTKAFPILKRHNVPACFFIATSLIGNNKLPWWDRIAYNYKTNKFKSIKLSSWATTVKYKGDDKEFVRDILAATKISLDPIEVQLKEIEKLFPLEGELPTQEFLSWENLAEMILHNMDVGAHSHNHEILANLSQDEIIYELTHSKMLIEQNLPYKVNSFSYPVGSQGTYNQSVTKALFDCGYDIAFNFQPGINVNIDENRYDLRRFSIEPSTTIHSLKNMLSYAKTY
ncbi:polysaccharide deacetylase family protein [Colwellia sp. BRX8-7]|uniref:polysaccharide deacetylase family protein n=1 Tax=Colwellia sp. BRX8-7 TaxID=2759833 RepID=UPI0015F53947|nr:polysaccharide deacetylase family protein [Colwellia sp. BRX8-7]MBA6336416.1 polysaccharide deacetylase family protein [Colwellia sp. BRX8-7]